MKEQIIEDDLPTKSTQLKRQSRNINTKNYAAAWLLTECSQPYSLVFVLVNNSFIIKPGRQRLCCKNIKNF